MIKVVKISFYILHIAAEMSVQCFIYFVKLSKHSITVMLSCFNLLHLLLIIHNRGVYSGPYYVGPCSAQTLIINID